MQSCSAQLDRSGHPTHPYTHTYIRTHTHTHTSLSICLICFYVHPETSADGVRPHQVTLGARQGPGLAIKCVKVCPLTSESILRSSGVVTAAAAGAAMPLPLPRVTAARFPVLSIFGNKNKLILTGIYVKETKKKPQQQI